MFTPNMVKTVVVFGAETSHSASVVRSLLKARDYSVKAVLSPAATSEKTAQALLGAQLVQLQSFEKSELLNHLAGAYGVYWHADLDLHSSDPVNTDVLIDNGKAVVDAARSCKIQHLVLHSAISPLKVLGLAAKHRDFRFTVEEYARQRPIDLTCIVVPLTYEYIFSNSFHLDRDLDGTFRFALPIGKSAIDFISETDIGDVVWEIFQNKQKFIGKTLAIAGCKLTVADIVRVCNKYLEPHRFKDRQITRSEYRDLLFPGCFDISNEFECLVRVDQQSSVKLTQQLNPKTKNFEQWLCLHVDQIQQVLTSML